ncbi:MAG TPA: dienelactone hydrolase family protein [Longimicrobium sp.]|nr:dienelactone hydrolase family protein [Longimicrobium sp.]
MRIHLRLLALLALPAAFGCSASNGSAGAAQADSGGPSAAAASSAQQGLPAGAAEADARLAASPRHGEWAMVSVDGGADSVRAWVVYPERRDRAPVVIVVHEIFGVSNWIRAVADQLAADGFIAVAPDFLTGRSIPMANGEPVRDSVTAAIRSLDQAQVQRRIDAAARWAMALPAAQPRYGIVGFCWGGSVSFAHAVHAPALGAAVVYYGTSPASERLASVRAPVLGLYGENDARVNATIAPADSAMRALGKTYEHETYPGAGHGFLRQQDGQNGANLSAAQGAWPRTIAFFRQHLRG